MERRGVHSRGVSPGGPSPEEETVEAIRAEDTRAEDLGKRSAAVRRRGRTASEEMSKIGCFGKVVPTVTLRMIKIRRSTFNSALVEQDGGKRCVESVQCHRQRQVSDP
jgi:hypothetical protein